MQFNPEDFQEYIDHTTDLEAQRKAQENCDLLTALSEQGKLEFCILQAVAKISILEKLLTDERAGLIDRSTDAAKNREKLIMLLNNIPQGDKK